MPVRHFFCAVAVLTALLACEPAEMGMTRDEVALQEVREASQECVDALRRLNHDGAAAAWADDALLMPSGAPDFVGGPAIHAMMSENYPKLRFVDLDIRSIRSNEVEIHGDRPRGCACSESTLPRVGADAPPAVLRDLGVMLDGLEQVAALLCS